MTGDLVTLIDDPQPGSPLMSAVMKRGRRLHKRERLDDLRAWVAEQIASLPEHLRQMEGGGGYPVAIGEAVEAMIATMEDS